MDSCFSVRAGPQADGGGSAASSMNVGRKTTRRLMKYTFQSDNKPDEPEVQLRLNDGRNQIISHVLVQYILVKLNS